MRIVNLVENTEGESGCEFAHGLSFYIETPKHKILMDLGPSDVTLRNAKKLGINLADVDTVILSHGHYDHSGGIMPFVELNKNAVIYMQKNAVKDYYADDGVEAGDARFRYIGIDKEIPKLPCVKLLDGDFEIDDCLSVFTVKKRSHKLPFTNARLLIKTDAANNEFCRDDFDHEHYLVIRDEESDKHILISGCAHNGILSILTQYKELYDSEPDVVISGFHLMKKTDYTDEELQEIKDIATELKSYGTKFMTCHCTSVPAYEIMKEIMGEKLCYVHSGDQAIYC